MHGIDISFIYGYVDFFEGKKCGILDGAPVDAIAEVKTSVKLLSKR